MFGKMKKVIQRYQAKDQIIKGHNKYSPLFMENVKDIADTMTKVMIICGIHRCKAKASRSIVVKAFQFYDIKRHSLTRSNQYSNGITRNDFISDLEINCLMTSIEALLGYVIVKRAIKAFYHETPEHGLRNAVAEAIHIKEQEFIWLHAARRIAEIFRTIKQQFFKANRNYRNQIINTFKSLHDRMKSRADPVIVDDCHLSGCGKKRIIVGTQTSHKECYKRAERPKYIRTKTKVYDIKSCHTLPNPCPLICNYGIKASSSLSKIKSQAKTKCNKTDRKLPRCNICNCPELICDCNIERNTRLLAIDCSQGPFQCQWIHMNKRKKPDLCIEKPEQHQCPVDCQLAYVSSEYKSENGNNMPENEDYESSDNDYKIEEIITKQLKSHHNKESCIRKEMRNDLLTKSLC